MNFDIRLPIGLLFACIGLLVGGFGLLDPAHATSLGVDIDLLWGGALLVAGVVLTALTLRRRGADRS